MDYKELNTKYGTKRFEIVKMKMIGRDVIGEQYINAKLETCEAGLGDFIKDYIDHIKIKKWHRKYDWNIVEERMRKILNKATVEWFNE